MANRIVEHAWSRKIILINELKNNDLIKPEVFLIKKQDLIF